MLYPIITPIRCSFFGHKIFITKNLSKGVTAGILKPTPGAREYHMNRMKRKSCTKEFDVKKFKRIKIDLYVNYLAKIIIFQPLLLLTISPIFQTGTLLIFCGPDQVQNHSFLLKWYKWTFVEK